jgi:hypothetical protein
MREQQPAADHADVRPLQFSMRTLLLSMAGVAVLVVVCQRIGPLWGTALVWFLILVAAHVAANSRGARPTRRPPSNRNDVAENASGYDDASRDNTLTRKRTSSADASKHSAPVTRLGISYGPAGRVLLCVITIGAALGATIGTVGLVFLTNASTSGILLGVISASVLGGILGFACGSFVLVMSRAFHEATQDPSTVAAYRRGETA